MQTITYRLKQFWILLFFSLMSAACVSDDDSIDGQVGERTGYRPVYQSYSEIRRVEMQQAQPLKNPGKIYVKDNYLFVNEVGKGIHILDNRNPASPVNLSFMSIPGNVDIAVKGNILYADNATDLLTIDISNPQNIRLLKRMENIFPYQMYPPFTGVDFECVDPAQGVVIRWEKTQLDNPKCFR